MSRGALNPAVAARVRSTGRAVAFAGVLLPLLMLVALKFTQIEVEALKPLISNTPWLAWLYVVFGETGTSRLLGTVELRTAALLIASIWLNFVGAFLIKDVALLGISLVVLAKGQTRAIHSDVA